METRERVLRFAALIRVSTERQEKEGESLRTQRAEIEHAVAQLGGTVTEWYGGQEHATPGHEKKEVGRLLDDAAKPHRRFDAIIVSNADRWSRDNEASHHGLEIFKKQNIRFFIGTTEHDLSQPEARLFLAMSAAVGHYQAMNQNRKSILNRIARAKRGHPTCGKLPYGRTFDRATGKWGIDPDKRRIMEGVARRYLAGEAIPNLAEEVGVNAASLHKTLTKRCGTTWKQTFDSDELNIHEIVSTTIPELLPEGTIRAILAKVAANRTYTHGQTKNKYLLGRMVICEHCGYAMFGVTNRGKVRYYRHMHAKRVRTCGASKGWVRADELEDAVLRHLFETFGNPAAVEKAIEEAIPDLDAARQTQKRLEAIDKLLGDERVGLQKVLRLVARGKVSEADAATTLDEVKQKISRMESDRDKLLASIPNAPTPEQIRDTARHVASKFKRVPRAFVVANAKTIIANADFTGMTWEEKRDLCQRVFAGKTHDGKRAGVYIEWPEGKMGRVRYTIRGLLDRSGMLPMAPDVANMLIDPDTVRADRQNEVLTKSTWH